MFEERVRASSLGASLISAVPVANWKHARHDSARLTLSKAVAASPLFGSENGGLHPLLCVAISTPRLAVMAGLFGVLACDRHVEPVVPIEVTVQEGPPPVLLLSHSPNAVADGEVAVQQLTHDVEWGGGENPPFALVADAAPLCDSSVAVMDRLDNQIVIVNRDGRVRRRIGREGDGPGEFRGLLAVERLSCERILVWQYGLHRTFMVVDTSGRLVRSVSAPIDGDWVSISNRGPRFSYDDVQRPPEDITRRIAGLPNKEGGIVHIVRPDEKFQSLLSQDSIVGPSYAVRYDSTLTVSDTLGMQSSPVLYADRRLGPRYEPMFNERLFAHRPVLAVGHGWYVFESGAANLLAVLSFSTDTIAVIEFGDARRQVTSDDQLAFMDHHLREALLDGPRFREQWRKYSRRERDRLIANQIEENYAFADSIPNITAVYGLGTCLFIAGFASEDFADGTSRTWLGIDIDTRSILGPFELPQADALRTRAVALDGFWATVKDSSGVVLLRHYPADLGVCRGDNAGSTEEEL